MITAMPAAAAEANPEPRDRTTHRDNWSTSRQRRAAARRVDTRRRPCFCAYIFGLTKGVGQALSVRRTYHVG